MTNGETPRSEATYNLLQEPWLPVRLVTGGSATLSLREVFHRASEIRDIVGDIPTQTFAITRLLLAILYRAPGGIVSTERWGEWWREGLPLTEIDAYLDYFADRFDLFGERPFFQVADLRTASAAPRDVSPLIMDLPTRNRLFTTRAGSGAANLSFAEAARWVINAQAFDVSGIKSGAIGDPRVKGGKGYPIGVGFSGLLGGVMAQGANLRETLLLNLVPHDSSALGADPDDDLPPWEEDEADTAAEREGLSPRGPVRLYTWQSRRIRLFPESGRVVGCLIANGDKLTPQNLQRLEPMTAWRFSEPQTKARKERTYMPREHLPGRALWRGISALLPGLSETSKKYGVDLTLTPAIVGWIQDDTFPFTARVTLRSYGVVYGSNNSVVDEVIHDEVILPVRLLKQEDHALAAQAEQAVRLADEGVSALRRLAENLTRAAGGPSDGASAKAAAAGYAAFDAPYRAWLAGLSDSPDPLDAIQQWHAIARRVLEQEADRLLRDAPPAAWAGRDVVGLGGRSDLVNLPRAEHWFRDALRRIVPLAFRKETAA